MSMQELISDLKASVEAQRAEIKRYQDAIDATEQKSSGMEAALATANAMIDEMKASIDGLIAKGNRLPGAGGEERKSYGQLFVESDAVKTAKANNIYNTAPVRVGKFERKYVVSQTANPDYVDHSLTHRVAGMVAPPPPEFRLRDVIPVIKTTESAISYIEELDFYHLYTKVASTASSSQKNIVVDYAGGFMAGSTIVIAAGTNDEQTLTVDTVNLTTNTITVLEDLVKTHTAGVTVTSDVFTVTAETKLKPNAQIKIAEETAKVQTLAHMITLTRQMYDDANALVAQINNRMIEGLFLSEEEQILYGTGVGQEILGFMSHTGVQNYAWSSGPATDTKLDAIRRALTIAGKSRYPADAIIVSPEDWEDMELAKGTDGHYVWVTVMDGGRPRVWRQPVIITSAMREDDALVGSFRLASALWDREEGTIRSTDSHDKYFQENKVAVLAEQRIALTIFRPQAFVKVDLKTAPSSGS